MIERDRESDLQRRRELRRIGCGNQVDDIAEGGRFRNGKASIWRWAGPEALLAGFLRAVSA